MNPADKTSAVPTWEQLMETIDSAAQHPEETQWAIYRYLKQHYPTVGSVMARTLLAAYIKMSRRQPSLIHSCMLALALKVSETYADFRLPQFLQAWGYDDCLRPDDRQPQMGKDGRRYLSLKERTERTLASWLLHHPQDNHSQREDIVSMYAVKVFEKLQQGRKHRFVKLVAPDGTGMVADSRQFPCKPWEIVGRMFDVLVRTSKEGNGRAAEIVASGKKVDEVFGTVVGYVDGIDEVHRHIHVYDALSRHLVAGAETVFVKGVAKGCYVRFSPIIGNDDPFKSAAVTAVMPTDAGRSAFGAREAVVQYVNAVERYVKYALCPASADGDGLSQEGFASLDVFGAKATTLAPGQHVHLTIFLKRGKDGTKRNHVADAY